MGVLPHSSAIVKKQICNCLSKLSKRDVKHHINLGINGDVLEDISDKKEVTYSEVKDYLFRKFESKVSTHNIAQVRRKLRIIERENDNRSK